MGNWINKSISTLTIVLFLVSLTPLPLFFENGDNDLRDIISEVQKLQQSTEKPSTNFKIVFSNAITTLKSVAGLGTTFSKEKTSSEPEKSQITISIRLPFLLPAGFLSPVEVVRKQWRPCLWECLYQSHIICPEPPPPISLFS